MNVTPTHYLAEVLKSAGYSNARRELIKGNSEGTELHSILSLTGIPYIITASCSDNVVGEQALKEALNSMATVGQGIVTDGSVEGTKIIRKSFAGGRYNYLPTLEPYQTPKPESSLFESNEFLSGKAEGIFFEAHSHIRDIDGFHSDEALDELCKVIYTKIFDEEQSAAGVTGHPVSSYGYGNSEELAATVRLLYSTASGYDSRVFSAKIPGYKRSRGVFDKPFRLSSPALAKVWHTVANYNLSNSNTDIKGRAFQKVLGPAVRSGMGQYFTPEAVVSFLVESIRPNVTDLILDPFCGSGRFLSHCLRYVRKTVGAENRALHEFAFGKLHGIEKSERMVRVAMTDMRLQGDGHSNIRCTDSLLTFSNYSDISPEAFDIVLTNPPFGSLLGAETLAHLGPFELAKSDGSTPLEIVGLERCFQFLRAGGKLGIVVPDGLLGDRSKERVRVWARKVGKVRAIVSLPISTFSPFGAAVKTSILIIRKWQQHEELQDEYPVFVAQVDDAGHDSTGRPSLNAELPSVAVEIRAFIDEYGW